MPRSRPNLVLIVSDQHRRDACGCFGSPVRRRDGGSPTPHLDALAARGVAFSRAYCPSPLCAPTRASYHTGLYPHRHGALTHKMLGREAGIHRHPGVLPGIPTLAEQLRAVGYRTAAIGKVHVHGEEATGWDMGFEERALRFYTHAPGMHYADLAHGDINRRYRELSPYSLATYKSLDPIRFASAPDDLCVGQNTLNQHQLETLVSSPCQMFDHMVVNASLDYLRRKKDAACPIFIHVGLEKPHEPWSVHREFLDLFDPCRVPLPATLNDWLVRGEFFGVQAWQHHACSGDADFVRKVMASYYACVASMDAQVGRLLAGCAHLGLDDSNTVFIYTSDHGELLFDHGLIYKHNFFEGSVAVPLVMAGFGLPVRARNGVPCSLVDLMPTLLDLAEAPPSSQTDGVSLRIGADAFGFDSSDRYARPIFSEFHQENGAAWGERPAPRRMVVQRNLKFIYTHGCRDQLFDLALDPHETNDLVNDQAYAEKYFELRHICLRAWRLDEHPSLGLRAARSEGGVVLNWDSAGPDAKYEILLETPDGRVEEVLASEVESLFWLDASMSRTGVVRYRVLAIPVLNKAFSGASGRAREGVLPVQTEEYPARLPVSELLEWTGDASREEVAPFFWQPATFAGSHWTYQGAKPELCSTLCSSARMAGPVLLLSPLGALSWKGTLVPLVRLTGRMRFVWAWLSPEYHHAFELDFTVGLARIVKRWGGSTCSVLAETTLCWPHNGEFELSCVPGFPARLKAGSWTVEWTPDKAVNPPRLGLEVLPLRECALAVGETHQPESPVFIFGSLS